MTRVLSLLLVIFPFVLIQWRDRTLQQIEIHHFPAGTIVKRERMLSKDWIWEAPHDWEALPAQQLRLATYKIQAGTGILELAVSELPGDAGGLLSNVNRWRGQLALMPLDAMGLPLSVRELSKSKNGARIVDIPSEGEPSPDGRAMLVGLLETPRATTFFKLSGDGASLGAGKDGFLAFLAGIRKRNPEGSIR